MKTSDVAESLDEIARMPYLEEVMGNETIAWVRGTTSYYRVASVTRDDDGTAVLELEDLE